MAKSKIVKANKKIEEKVVGGYKKIEDGVVSGFTKMTDKFVDNFLTKEGESVEEAKNVLRKSRRKENRKAQKPQRNVLSISRK